MEKRDPNKTLQYIINNANEQKFREILKSVFISLNEKGYDPINQIVGYILSEDPTYITNHNGARALITKMDRNELLKILVASYLDSSTTDWRQV
ncbi:MAG: IreB family regulatory phosphoprotein [Clostridia bacterium]|nr:IreB family regulatory phosphoprotein [Clostridia bacterium]